MRRRTLYCTRGCPRRCPLATHVDPSGPSPRRGTRPRSSAVGEGAGYGRRGDARANARRGPNLAGDDDADGVGRRSAHRQRWVCRPRAYVRAPRGLTARPMNHDDKLFINKQLPLALRGDGLLLLYSLLLPFLRRRLGLLRRPRPKAHVPRDEHRLDPVVDGQRPHDHLHLVSHVAGDDQLSTLAGHVQRDVVQLAKVPLRLIPESLERRAALPAAVAEQLVRLLDGVELLEARIRVAVRMFRRNLFPVDALDVLWIVVDVDAERGGRGGEALGGALLRLVRVHRHLERAPVLDAEFQLGERNILDHGAGHEVGHSDCFFLHSRELGLDGWDALDLVGTGAQLLGLRDVAADGLEELLSLRVSRVE